MFVTSGVAAPVRNIAKAAGVGMGTIYRHFPTRQALFEAVYRHEVDQLVALAARLECDTPPLDALRLWMRANVAFMATKKGMSAALAGAVQANPDLTASSVERLSRAADTLLRRAARQGVIRDDVGAQDVLRTVVGLCYVHDKPGWQESVLRLVDVFVDGMRLG